MTPYRVRERMNVGGVERVTLEEIRAVVDIRPNGRRIDPQLRKDIERLRLTGITVREISERLAAPLRTVQSVCAWVDLTPEQKQAIVDRKTAAARAAQVRRRAAERNEVPTWVPDRLHDLYANIAEHDCEEQAAIVCRRLKHGASVAWL